MLKKFRLSTVAAIVLALVAPASPASNADQDSQPLFSTQNVDIQVSVIDNMTGQIAAGGVQVERVIGEWDREFVGQFPDETTPEGQQVFTFTGLTDGDYIFSSFNWENDLYLGVSFEVTISGGAVSYFSVQDQPNETISPNSSGVYELPTYRANFYAQVLYPDGSPFINDWWGSGSQVHATLQMLSEGIWVDHGFAQPYDFYENDVVVESGIKGRALDASGTYRLKVRPEGVAGVAETISSEFSISTVNQEPQRLPAVTLDTPGMQVNVVAPGSTTPIPQSYVRLITDDCCQDFDTYDASSPIALTFPSVGTFEIEVATNNQEFSDLAKASYSVVVTEVDGKLVGAVTGETPVNGVYNLELRDSNLTVKIIDPRDDTVINNAQATIFQYSGGQRRDYVASSWSQNGNAISFSVDDGTYLVDVRPENGDYLLASNSFLLTVSNSGSTVVVETNETTPQALTADADGVFLLPAAIANLIGAVVDASGNPVTTDWQMRKWVSVDLLKFNGEWYDWDSNANVDDQGRFSFNVSSAGDYRIEIRPQGYANSANLSFDFTVVESDLSTTTTLEYPANSGAGTIVLPEPDVRIAVRAPGGASNLASVQIDIFQNNEYISNSNTSSGGVAAITFPDAGTYQIRVNPPRSAVGTARATYDATLTISGSDRSVSILGGTLVDGIYILELGEPTLSGQVTSPDGSQAIRDLEVIPVDRSTGWEMWELSGRTNAFGQFSIALPEGEWDVYARAPYGDTTVGDSDRIGPIVVDASGAATSLPTGYDALAFEIRLNLPTWTGTMVSPDDSSQVITNGNICLATGSNDLRTWTCSQTNGLGEWALSKPAGFTGFQADDELFISEWGTRQFAEKRLRGATEIEAALGVWVDGETYSDIELSPAAPNLKIYVQAGLDGEGNPAPARNAWVSVDDGREWLGGGNTNSAGIAAIAIPDDTLTSALNIQVNIEHSATLSENFAGLRYEAPSDSSATAPREINLSLPTPNFKVYLSEPSGGPSVAYGRIEVVNESTGEWMGGSNTNSAGNASINLASGGTYAVTVNPAWNAGATFSKNSYVVVVDGNGDVTGVTNRAGQSVTADGNGVYGLELGTPSVSGVVTDSNGTGVRDSWISPIEQNGWEYLWWLGTNSRSGGSFSMNLDDGIYLLEANPSWNNSAGDTKSKRCSIEVSSGAINTGWAGGDKCSLDGSSVQLQLRAPNVTFTLKSPSGDVVPYANVGMWLNGWSVWSQANRDGVVALNLDADEIKERAGITSAGTYDIRIVVDPPYGSSDLARFECNSTDADELCSEIPDFVLDGLLNASFSAALSTGFEASFAAPNTRVRVADPNGDPLLERGSWVNIFAENGGNRSWLAAGNSDANGFVSFNLDLTDSSQTYYLEIHPPHGKRGEYAQASYSGLLHSELNEQTFNLSAPNLKLKVLDATGLVAAKWAWVGVEVVDPANNNAYVAWAGGAGTDRSGVVSLTLADSKRYRVMLNPQPSTEGSFTSCLFDVDGSGVVTKVAGSCDTLASENSGVWEISLSAGNLVGRAYYVDDSTNPVYLGGAIVVASSGGQEVTTTTKADGSYALQLDEGLTWTIEVFYVPKASDPAFATSGNKLTLENVVASSTQQTRDALYVR